MLGILYAVMFLSCGTRIVWLLLPKKQFLVRIWLGMALGVVLMMWLPALCAFPLGYTLEAHAAAAVLLLILLGLAYWGRNRSTPVPFSEKDRNLILPILLVVVPLTIVGCYLQWTHTICAVNGTLHVGQSTYGDLPLHLSIASGARNASFPLDYSILPGELLTYPFLADTLATSFMLFGWSLQQAMVWTACLMMALTFLGYLLLAQRIAEKRNAAVLAALFFFINGGLGFMYLVDMQGVVMGRGGNNELQSVTGLFNRIRLVLQGWYQTPANHAEFTTYNLRWSNVIADMMVPQRTTLAGWCAVLPCIYLLFDAVRPQDEMLPGVTLLQDADGPTAIFSKRIIPVRQLILLGFWAGSLPMINTHCFLALGLLSAGWMVYDLIRNRIQLGRVFGFWMLYGILAVLVSAPQLFTWTFHQAVGNNRFVRLHFNWVNGEFGMADGYLWFYIKNIGLPFILLLLSLLEKNEKRRFVAAGAFTIFIVAEFVVFQPNVYDNNKLFYIWYMLCAILAAEYGLELLHRLKGLRGQKVIAALAAVCCFATGTLSIARECVSDYEMYNQEDIAAAAYVEENVPQDAVFLTGTQHINFVSSLAGRRIVCGPDLWLYYHGFNTWERQVDLMDFYADPENNMDILTRYDVDYILVSNQERETYNIDEDALMEHFPLIYESEDGWSVRIYEVPKG